MNEATWQRVLAWEALHADACPCGPKLLRFLGRPHDLSPLARAALVAGGPAPFDRHDWVVDRCGREVRYVIDFYFDEGAAGTPGAFSLRVRPALDSPGAALDRIKMGVYTAFAAAGLPCPVTGAPGRIGAAAAAGGRVEEGEGSVKPE
jgi:cytochrome c heme-lyase